MAIHQSLPPLFPWTGDSSPGPEEQYIEEEARVKIVKTSQKLFAATSDSEKAALLHKLRRQISHLKAISGNLSSDFIKGVKKQVEDLSKAALHQKHPEQVDLQSECQHLLSELDPSHSLGPLKKLARFHLQHHAIAHCLEVLQEMSPKLPVALQQRIAQIKDVPIGQKTERAVQSLCRTVMKVKEGLPISPNEQQGLVEIDKMFISGDVSPVDAATASGIADLLVTANGNLTLNKALREKSTTTPAEQFLIRFSYATHYEKKARTALAKLQHIFANDSIQAFLDATKSCHQSTLALKAFLQQLVDAPPAGTTPQVRDELRKAVDEVPATLLGWHWLESAPSSLSSIKALLELLPAGSVPETIFAHLQNAQTQATLIKNSCVPKMHKLAKEIPQEQRVTREELMILARYSDLITPISQIQKMTRRETGNNCFNDLTQTFISISESMWQTEIVFHTLPGFQPGDVLLDIEELEKKPSQTLWSKERKRPGFHPLIPFQLLYEGITKGIWAIGPYFVGKVRHASMTYSEQGALGATEVFAKGFIQAYMPVRTGMKRIGYRPNFESSVTEQGKKLLQKLWPESMTETLHQQYAAEVHKIMRSQRRRFSLMYTNPIRAWESLARDLAEKGWKQPYGLKFVLAPLAGLLRLVGTAGLTLFWAPVTLYKKIRHQNIFPSASNIDIVCSEYVLELAANAQKQLEKLLIEKLKKLEIVGENEQVQLFHPLIPPRLDIRTVHPKKLRSILKAAHYTKLPTPLGIELILQESPPSHPKTQK